MPSPQASPASGRGGAVWREALRAALPGAVLAAALGLWGLSWGLPELGRASRVLPPEAVTPEFLKTLVETWRERQATTGAEPLSKDNQQLGFEAEATVEPGWSSPPPLLMNSSRSFFVRSVFEDESNVLIGLARIKPHRLEFNPKLYTAYGGAYFLTLGAWMAGVAVVTPFELVRDLAFYVGRLDQMAWLYLSGRLLACFLHVLISTLVAAIGWRFWGRGAGLWAGLFSAAAPVNVLLAHILKPGPLGLAATCGLFWCCAALVEDEEPARKRWRLAGLLLGLAAGATNLRWDAGLLLVATAWLRRGRGLKPRPGDLAGFLESCALAFGVYFLTNPFLILEASTAWPWMLTSPGHSSRDPAELVRLLAIGLPKGLTPGVAAWLVAGLVAALAPGKPVNRLLLSAFALFAATALVTQGARYVINLRHYGGMPFACLLAGIGVAARWDASGFGGLVARGAAALSLAWAVWVSGVIDLNLSRETAGRSTKDAAGAWLEANVPPGSELGMFKLPQPGNSAYFRWDRYRLRFIDSRKLAEFPPERLPERFVLVGWEDGRDAQVGAVLGSRYRVEALFEPVLVGPLGPPIHEMLGNPMVQVFRKL